MSEEKLLFRPICSADAETFFNEGFGDPETTRYLQWTAHQSVEETQLLIDEMTVLHKSKTKSFYVAESKGAPIGLGSVRPDGHTAWIGFLVLKGRKRNGYGSQILSALEALVYESAHTALASVDQMNTASIRLLEKRGWKRRPEGDRTEANMLVYQKPRCEQTP